jgi:hypothetical protein
VNYINIKTGEACTIHELRKMFPLTLFPDDFAGDFEGFAYVQPVDKPEHDAATHKAVEGAPVLVAGQWQQAWDVVALTQQELDDARRAGIPTSCTPAQGLIALYALQSITEEDIATAIAAIPDPVQRYSAQIGYTRATTWERTSATMQALAALLGLSESELDALFIYAGGVAL